MATWEKTNYLARSEIWLILFKVDRPVRFRSHRYTKPRVGLMANEKKLHLFMRRFLSPVIRFNRNDKICGVCTLYREGDFIHTDSPHVFSISFAFSPGVQNWFGLTEKFQVLKICPGKIPKFASGNFFNVAILVRQTAPPSWILPPNFHRRLRLLNFATDRFAIWRLRRQKASTLPSRAFGSRICLRPENLPPEKFSPFLLSFTPLSKKE